MTNQKREKPEDFIGWKSDDGLLEVVDIHGKQGTLATFKVICLKCIEDKELFPEGYFVSRKEHLINGNKPCGCAFNPKWNQEQFLVLARRAAQGRFIVQGFSEEFHGSRTKLNLECLKDGHKWTATLNNIINNGYGCSKCCKRYRPTEQEAFDICKRICETEGYAPLGFVGGYITSLKSRFEYECPVHGIQNVRYHGFVTTGTRCKGCYKERQKESGNMNGYYPERKDEKDFLYVLDFDSKFLKVGRSFDVDRRIGELMFDSKIKNIYKLRIFSATHQEIYDLEQELHTELRERNFQHYVKWSTECFQNESLFILDKLLDSCGFEEVIY